MKVLWPQIDNQSELSPALRIQTWFWNQKNARHMTQLVHALQCSNLHQPFLLPLHPRLLLGVELVAAHTLVPRMPRRTIFPVARNSSFDPPQHSPRSARLPPVAPLQPHLLVEEQCAPNRRQSGFSATPTRQPGGVAGGDAADRLLRETWRCFQSRPTSTAGTATC